MRRLRDTLFVVLAAQALYAAASAQEASNTPPVEPAGGFYARVFGGLSTLNDTSVVIGSTRASGRFGSGAIAGGAFGYRYGGPWRAEVEYAYRSSSLDRLGGSTAVKGDYASTSVMVNGLYSFRRLGRVEPYIGAGIGITREIDFDVTGGANAGQYSDSGSVALQAIAGAEVSFGSGWSGFGEVRAFGADSPALKGPGRTLKADYRTVDILVGVSRRF